MSASFSDISFVVQGPVFRDLAGEDLTLKSLDSIRRICPGAEIILSTWAGQNIDGLPFDVLVQSEDPGAFKDKNGEGVNMNRQLVSTQAGLAKASRKYSVKFRADFLLANSNFVSVPLPNATAPLPMFDAKIRMTNLFVQNPEKMPFLFHLSDLIQFGLTKDLFDLWTIPLYLADEILNLDPKRNPELGVYLGGSVLRLRNEQALPLGFLKKKGFNFQFENPNQMDSDRYSFFEKFLTSNFDVMDWEASGLIFPARMMDSFLETVFTRAELDSIAKSLDQSEERFKNANFNKRFKFLFNRAYLFHLKKELVFRYPFTLNLFKRIKSFQKLIFGRKLKGAEEARALLADRKKELR